MSRLRRPLTLLVTAILLALLVPLSAAAAVPTRLEGRLVYAHGDAFPDETVPHTSAPGVPDNHGQARSFDDYTLVTDDGTAHPLAFRAGKGPDGFANGARVRVEGTLSGGALAVATANGSAQVVAPATATAAATVAKQLLVLLVNFTTNTATPYSAATAAGTDFTNANSVASYIAEESDGQLSMTGDVKGYYTINFDTTGCNFTDLATKAKAAAQLDGVVIGNYTNIQYVFPNLSACGWAGLAYLPGTESWINQALNLRVASHELSHNFGVHHASTWSCTENGVRVAIAANTGNCTASEYGDPFTVMGSASTRHTHNQQLASLGWLPTSQRQTVTTSGTYVLGAAEDTTAAVRAIQVPRGDGTFLYLEIRRPTGTQFDNFATTDPAVTGVSIRVSNSWTSVIQSKLLDTTPETSTFADAPLAVGRTFSDPTPAVNITTVSIDPSTYAATVTITWGPDVSPPTTPTNLAASLASASSVALSWSPSSDNAAVTGYRVSREAAVVGTPAGTSFTDTGLAPGQYTWSVQALDAAGNASTAATVTFTVPVPDTMAPSAPTNLRTTSLTKSRVSLAWNAATDNGAVTGYRVYRNDGLVATVTTLTFSEARARTQSTYVVYAVDAAGNVSPASNSVVVAAR